MSDCLMRKYRAVSLEELYNVKKAKNSHGICTIIKSEYKRRLYFNESHKVRQKVLSNLKLLNGIGEVTEGNLRREGYNTIKDLCQEPCYYSQARALLDEVYRSNPPRLVDLLSRKLAKSDPLVFLCSSLYDKENILAIDIETMGLGNVPVVLFGIGRIFHDSFCLT